MPIKSTLYSGKFRIHLPKGVMAVLVATVLLLPIIIVFYVYPTFIDFLKDRTEADSVQIGVHLSRTLFSNDQDLGSLQVTEKQIIIIDEAIEDFNLMKVKIFSDAGVTLYSSEMSDIGIINKHHYFKDVVAKGQPFTKLVKKDSKSLEGEIVKKDVVETYVPIMRGGIFAGAFEIYYDITLVKSAFDRLYRNVNLILFPLSLCLFLVACLSLFKLNKSLSLQLETEEYLKTILSTIQAGVIVTDSSNGEIVEANPSAAEIIGKSQESLLGEDFRTFMGCECYLQNTSDPGGGKGGRDDCELTNAEGKMINLRRSSATVHTRNKEYHVQSFLDITDLKKLLEQQELNIGLAKNILGLINGITPRYIDLNGDLAMFFDAVSIPCNIEGGDHFFIKETKAGKQSKTILTLKDQSGHAVNCILRNIISDLVHNSLIHQGNACIDETISRLNNEICGSALFNADDFFTAITVEIDHQSLLLKYLSAGHPPFLLIREGAVASLPGSSQEAGANLPLAIQDGLEFSTGELQLEAGDKLIFYTDGLTEMPLRNKGRIITIKELRKIVQELVNKSPAGSVREIIDRLLDVASEMSDQKVVPFGQNTSDDDVTILGIEIERQDNYREETLTLESAADVDKSISFLTEIIGDELLQKGYQIPEINLRTVLTESILNSWKHGNQKDPAKHVIVRWRDGIDFDIEVIDEGGGVDVDKIPDPKLSNNIAGFSGRGIFLILKYADFVRWKKGGKHIVMSFQKNQQKNIQPYKPKRMLPLWKLG